MESLSTSAKLRQHSALTTVVFNSSSSKLVHQSMPRSPFHSKDMCIATIESHILPIWTPHAAQFLPRTPPWFYTGGSTSLINVTLFHYHLLSRNNDEPVYSPWHWKPLCYKYYCPVSFTAVIIKKLKTSYMKESTSTHLQAWMKNNGDQGFDGHTPWSITLIPEKDFDTQTSSLPSVEIAEILPPWWCVNQAF